MKPKKKIEKITQEQRARIYCVKHGHAPYVWTFWGYVHCGRCGEQIGDRLGSVFDLTNKIIVTHKNCRECRKVLKKAKLNAMDRTILKRVRRCKTIPEYEKILKGIKFRA